MVPRMFVTVMLGAQMTSSDNARSIRNEDDDGALDLLRLTMMTHGRMYGYTPCSFLVISILLFLQRHPVGYMANL